MEPRKLYFPLTAGNGNHTYIEKSANAALAPYIRCYWYYEDIAEDYDNLVIPDTCVDIIFSVGNEGSVTATFCGANDQPYSRRVPASFSERKYFAVRFYVWSFCLFSGDALQHTRNVIIEAEYFLGHYVNEMKKILCIESKFDDFTALTEKLLTKQLNEKYQNPDFMNAVYHVLKNKGNLRIDELADQSFISKRHLERLFLSRMDLSPKQFADLIRYQNTWRGILLNKDVKEMVFQLGYSDQSHLIRSFKKYHGITPCEAKQYADRMKRTKL
jgi:AraC-like DNA-binding protein